MISIRTVIIYLLRAGLTGKTEGISIPELLDWQKLIDEVNRLGVAVHASDGLQVLFNQGIYRINDDKDTRRLKARWFGKTMEYEHRYEKQLASAIKLGKWLNGAGIMTVVLKGNTVSECYPIPAHRYSSDFDCFLIKDGEHTEAWEQGNKVVEAHGVEVGRGFYKNSSFHIDGLYVENHKLCTPCRGNSSLISLERFLQQIILNGPLIPLGNTGLWVPPPMFSALFLTEHSYSHFLHEGLSFKHVLDWLMFRRKHWNDIDWTKFNSYCREFGFTRFVESINHLGDYVLGIREESELIPIERRMLDSIWDGPRLHPGLDPHSIVAKFAFAGNTIRSAWKYRAYSNISMCHALWIQFKGVVFARQVRI